MVKSTRLTKIMMMINFDKWIKLIWDVSFDSLTQAASQIH